MLEIDFTDQLAKADNYFRSNNLNEAKIILDEILDCEPHQLTALEKLVDVEIKLKDYERAAELLSKIFLIDPEDQYARNKMKCLETEIICNKVLVEAKKFIDLKMYAEAKQLLLEALSINPFNVTVLTKLAEIEIVEKNFTEAAVLLQRIIELEPTNNYAIENISIIKNNLKALAS